MRKKIDDPTSVVKGINHRFWNISAPLGDVMLQMFVAQGFTQCT
uniref:Uncharacterized protein n=1 Tax=uncultured bacterium contig00107 TaxID=1181573 RepID=A0A806KHU9_9BACT|nr:hypothetical protein [uncultured bacterium contig00107]